MNYMYNKSMLTCMHIKLRYRWRGEMQQRSQHAPPAAPGAYNIQEALCLCERLMAPQCVQIRPLVDIRVALPLNVKSVLSIFPCSSFLLSVCLLSIAFCLFLYIYLSINLLIKEQKADTAVEW